MERPTDIAHEIIQQHRDRDRFHNLTGELAPRDIAEAYAAQAEFHRLNRIDGRGALGGRKIALASPVQQELCGIDHPIAGGIFASEIQESPAEISLSAYHGLGIEFELAAVISRDISRPGSDRDNIRAHIRALCPAFELIMDRGADYACLGAETMIADNAWGAGVVLGPPIPDWQKLEVETLPCRLAWTGEEDAEAVAGDADPLGSLAWVANLVTEQGGTIKAGEVVITGSVIKTRYPKGPLAARYEIAGQAVELTVI
ncbi:MAG: fumarylacetoacetate hydrolase family protein [Pseudomonadota bacterium]